LFVKLNTVGGNNMTPRKITTVREVTVAGGIGERRGFVMYDEDTGDLIEPTGRMGPEGISEWNRIMELLSNVNGHDLRHIIDGPALLDHCLNTCECNIV
jgi:hypothetical protein